MVYLFDIFLQTARDDTPLIYYVCHSHYILESKYSFTVQSSLFRFIGKYNIIGRDIDLYFRITRQVFPAGPSRDRKKGGRGPELNSRRANGIQNIIKIYTRASLTFELEPFDDVHGVLNLLLLALDPVEHERAQAQIAHEHDEPDDPSADHFIACRSDQIIAPDTNAVCAIDATPTRRMRSSSSPRPRTMAMAMILSRSRERSAAAQNTTPTIP